MSNPSTPSRYSPYLPNQIYRFIFISVRPLQTTSNSQRSRTLRSVSNERDQSSLKSPTTPLDLSKTQQRPQSATRGDRSARSPTQQHVSNSCENNSSRKTTNNAKSSYSTGQ
jgi:hypothetical protein